MPTDPYIGQVLLGLFRVTEVIGGGATGTVYRGWQAGMERDVAIKILHRDLAGDGDLRLRFFREARAVARLSHPNIVTVFLVDETEDGQPYLVMEHVSGPTLESVLATDGILAAARAVAIARQIASALAEAHAAGVVHRDLKPANIIIQRRGARRADGASPPRVSTGPQGGAPEIAKVVDFGVAKLVGSDVPMAPGESQLTRQGEVFGTPSYLSPEQARGGEVDARADIYSFGVILYRMVTGALPFTGEGLAVLLAHINQPPRPPREVVAEIDPALEALILGCLEKDRAARPQNAEALVAALDSLRPSVALTAVDPKAAQSGERPSVERPSVDPNVAAGRPSVDPNVAAGRPSVDPKTAETSKRPLGKRPSVDPMGADWSAADWRAKRPSVDPRDASEPRWAKRPSVDDRSEADWELPAVRKPRWRIWALVLVVAAGAFFGWRTWANRATVAAPDDPRKAAAADAAPVPTLPAGPRRAVMMATEGYSLRVLMPDPVVAGQRVTIIIDAWDGAGVPITANSVPVTLGDDPAQQRTAVAAGMDGRYAVSVTLPPGEVAFGVVMPETNTTLTVYLTAEPGSPRL